MTTLVLVRHAEAQAADDLRLPGPDHGLTTTGREQAERLAAWAESLQPATIWTSDFRRAMETAEAMSRRLGREVMVEPGLREFDFGLWSGRTYAEIVAADPTAAAWFERPESGRPPGGESLAEAASRVTAALDRAATSEAASGPVIVVGHAGTLRLAAAQGLGMRLADAWRLRLDCGSASVVGWGSAGIVVVSWNNISQFFGRVVDHPNTNVTLILGGVRSGKSALAERIAVASGRPVLFVATARVTDGEMAERVARHRATRPGLWRTVEAPLDLVGAVEAGARDGDLVVVDCLTVWLGNRLVEGVGLETDPELVDGSHWEALEAEAVSHVVALCELARPGRWRLVLVSNEVGLGVVPATTLGRRYRDALGRVNQAVAAAAGTVLLAVAGIGVDLRALERASLAGFAS